MKISKKYLKDIIRTTLREVSEESYKKIAPQMRVHVPRTREPEPIEPRSYKQPSSGSKPNGFWYGFGAEWIDWCRKRAPLFETNDAYEILVDDSKILKINSLKELEQFSINFDSLATFYPRRGQDFSVFSINWQLVSRQYSGIEISPYMYSSSNPLLEWYDPWDIASGCIWNFDAIKSVQKV